MTAAPGRRIWSWLRRRWIVIAFVLAYAWSFPWFPNLCSANELPRAYLTMAMVDDGTFAIDGGVKRWGKTADVSPSRGHHYSNKAPGSSMLAIPGYLLLEGWHAVIGGEPTLTEVMWMSRFTTGIVPSLLFLWLLWGFLARFTPSEAARRVVLVGFGVGSMFFLYSILFISHPLAAIAVAASWIVAIDALERDGAARRWRLVLVGFLAGCAPLVDYQAVFAAVPVAIWVVVRLFQQKISAAEWARLIGCAVAGAAVPVLLLLYYHHACFGSPWKTGYDASKTFEQNHGRGFIGMDQLRWRAFVGSTIDPDNGLLVLWPMAALAVPGWVLMFRKREQRGHAAVTLAVAVLFLLFISSINFWRGGWQVGPRYIMAMLPFLLPPIVVAVAAAERTWWLRGGALGLCLVGLVTYGLTAALYPYFPDVKFVNPVHELTLRLLADGHVPWNLGWLVGLRGLASLVPYLVILAALAAWAALPTRREWRSALLGVAIAAAMVASYRGFGDGGRAAEVAYQHRVETMPGDRVVTMRRCP